MYRGRNSSDREGGLLRERGGEMGEREREREREREKSRDGAGRGQEAYLGRAPSLPVAMDPGTRLWRSILSSPSMRKLMWSPPAALRG
jgi:hypothetical protein